MITNGCTYCEASGWLCDECHVERSIGDLMAEACYNAVTSMQQLNETFTRLQVRSAQLNAELAEKVNMPWPPGAGILELRHLKKGQSIIPIISHQARRFIRKLQKRKQ